MKFLFRVENVIDGYVTGTGWRKSDLTKWRKNRDTAIPEFVFSKKLADIKFIDFKGDDGSSLQPCVPQIGDLICIWEEKSVIKATLERHIITIEEKEKLKAILEAFPTRQEIQ